MILIIRSLIQASDKLGKGGLLELRGRFCAVMFHEIVDHRLLETQLNSDVLAENDLAFENVCVNKYHFNGGVQIVELLVQGKGAQGVDRLRIAHEFINFFVREVPFAGDPEDHIALDFGEMLVGLGEVDEDVELFFGDDIHVKQN